MEKKYTTKKKWSTPKVNDLNTTNTKAKSIILNGPETSKTIGPS